MGARRRLVAGTDLDLDRRKQRLHELEPDLPLAAKELVHRRFRQGGAVRARALPELVACDLPPAELAADRIPDRALGRRDRFPVCGSTGAGGASRLPLSVVLSRPGAWARHPRRRRLKSRR